MRRTLATLALAGALVALPQAADAAPVQTKTHCSDVGDIGRVCSATRYRVAKQHPRTRSIRACLSSADGFGDPAAIRGRFWVTTKWAVIKWQANNLTYPNDGPICVRRWVGGVDAGRFPRVLVSGVALTPDGTRVGWAQWTALP